MSLTLAQELHEKLRRARQDLGHLRVEHHRCRFKALNEAAGMVLAEMARCAERSDAQAVCERIYRRIEARRLEVLP